MTLASKHPSAGQLLAYGSLRMPLALLELPLYVLLPVLYSDTLGMPLAIVGGVLFACRLVDAVADPWIGSTIDNNQQTITYRRWILIGLPILAIGFWFLLNPLTLSGSSLIAWLAIMSIVTYLSYSVVSISYQAWGALIGNTDVQRARVTGYREGAGLVGVIIASLMLTPDQTKPLALLLIFLALLSAWLLRFAPAPIAREQRNQSEPGTGSGLLRNLSRVWTNRSFRWLILVFVLNGIATAIPATLVLFFIADILQLPDRAPVFLAAYFFSGALGMPLWIRLSAAIGLRNSWLVGMGCSVIAFAWALGMNAGDSNGFMVVCVLTGLALGADLAMPPALLAAVIGNRQDQSPLSGTYFGIWNFTTKANLAIAAGLALPMLSAAGYEPGTPGSLALVLMYAALPCLLKIIAGMALIVAPLHGITNPSQVTEQ